MEELRPEFDKRGVKVVTVSVDLPEVIAESGICMVFKPQCCPIKP